MGRIKAIAGPGRKKPVASNKLLPGPALKALQLKPCADNCKYLCFTFHICKNVSYHRDHWPKDKETGPAWKSYLVLQLSLLDKSHLKDKNSMENLVFYIFKTVKLKNKIEVHGMTFQLLSIGCTQWEKFP